jgi:hypothetical protein
MCDRLMAQTRRRGARHRLRQDSCVLNGDGAPRKERVMDTLMSPWVRYLIAFVVFCHGFIYVRIGWVLPGPVKEWRGRSWLLGDAIAGEQLTTLIVGLHVIAGIVVLACAAAIGFAPSLPGWWRPLAIVGAAFGIAAFAAFWDGQTGLLLEEGAIGAAVSLMLLVSAMTLPRALA